ncbi:universal stress protein, partial [Escherichia coli]
MNRTILVPIDISDSELTQRVISHVEAEAKIDDAEVHFLTVIPSLPYYALMNPLMILVKIIKLRWIHILSYDQMVSRKINNQTTRCANS